MARVVVITGGGTGIGAACPRLMRAAGDRVFITGRREAPLQAVADETGATALVGDAATVAERINEYAALGIDSFIFSGYPHLEEAYRVGELLFPLLDVAVPSIPQPQNLRLQGEAVANEFIPRKVAQS
ncbi:hypothetical protein DD571_21510 [Klebsiella pneumoniae]|nr:hypothetical protein DD571_21510 [Klebsiella pneumoniae]